MILVAVAVMILAGTTWFIRGGPRLRGRAVRHRRDALPRVSGIRGSPSDLGRRRPVRLRRRPPLRLCPAAGRATHRRATLPRRQRRRLHPRGRFRFSGRAAVGLAVLAVGVLGLFDAAMPGFHPDFHHYVALGAGVVGRGLVVGAWFGRPAGLGRSRPDAGSDPPPLTVRRSGGLQLHHVGQ